jgi:hypothetical protein
MTQGTVAPELETAANAPTESASERVENAARPWRRGFWSLVITQFQGAFNENGLKNLVVFLILGMAMQKADRDRLVLVVGTLFSIHFVLDDGRLYRGSLQQAHRYHRHQVIGDGRDGVGYRGTGLAEPEP